MWSSRNFSARACNIRYITILCSILYYALTHTHTHARAHADQLVPHNMAASTSFGFFHTPLELEPVWNNVTHSPVHGGHHHRSHSVPLVDAQGRSRFHAHLFEPRTPTARVYRCDKKKKNK